MIKAAVDEARKHPTSFEAIKKAAEGIPQEITELKLSDRPPEYKPPMVRQQVLIPVGYRAAISFEEQPEGLCRHLSISIKKKGRMPTIEAVMVLCAHFGINWDKSVKWVEEFEPGRHAINIVSLDSDADEPDSAKAFVERLNNAASVH